jgi:hypothetical protein
VADQHGDEALTELLRTAAPTRLPPAGFDHGSVLAASRRAGVRRQRLLAGGAAAVVVLLAGGGALAVLGGPGEQSTAASAAAGQQEDPAPRRSAPGAASQPRGAGTCGPTDRTVYAALQRVFPELAAQPPFPLARACPAGTTGAGVLLSADGVVGRVEVLVGPAAVTATDGATGTATTADGRTLTVVSVPAGGSPAGPYADRLDDVARRVAAALG